MLFTKFLNYIKSKFFKKEQESLNIKDRKLPSPKSGLK